jgi:hypothetical protein
MDMHSGVYALLFLGALAGGFVAGLAGFGTALMALGIWLYVLPPSLAVPLVLICSVVAQSSTLPSMWKSFDLTLVWPFVVGGLLGVPIGTMWREGRGRGDRLCRRHSRRPGRPVGAAAHSLGEHPRLGQGRTARHFSDLQLGGARRRALSTDGHRPRRATVIWLALLAFPGTIIGTWLGARLYHALNDRNFTDVVLALLLLSGAGLVWSSIGPH